MDFKPIFKSPDSSILAALATVAVVAGIYMMDAGSVSEVHASDAHHPANSAGIKKAGWTSLVAIAGLTALSRDLNQTIIGGAAIVAFHAHYRHANMVNPGTGQIELKGSDAYQNAQWTSSAQLQAVA